MYAGNIMKKAANTRRNIIKKIGAMGAGLCTVILAGCAGRNNDNGANNNGNASGSDSTDPTQLPNAQTLNWASGTTDAITVDFPDDNIFDSTHSCAVALTRQTTAGPCYYASTEQEDMAHGKQGLPMQLCLQVIDEACNLVSGITVEVWHCDNRGIYSANTADSTDAESFNTGFCSGGDAAALSKHWFRAELVTDNAGRVNFKSCLPGWYPSRPIHIHFRVRNNGVDSSVSQFGFSDEFCKDIYTTHPHYIDRGEQDTSLEGGDFIFGNNFQDLLMNIRQNDDGSLLAYKRIQISA